MANKNSMAVARANRKEAKQSKQKINSRFGAPGNLNKSRKDYTKVYKKSLTGGAGA